MMPSKQKAVRSSWENLTCSLHQLGAVVSLTQRLVPASYLGIYYRGGSLAQSQTAGWERTVMENVLGHLPSALALGRAQRSEDREGVFRMLRKPVLTEGPPSERRVGSLQADLDDTLPFAAIEDEGLAIHHPQATQAYLHLRLPHTHRSPQWPMSSSRMRERAETGTCF